MLWLISVLLCLPAGADETARNEAVARAREALSERFEADLEAVRLVRTESATWSDTSLGCPEEGRDYDPLTRSSYRVFLKVDHCVHKEELVEAVKKQAGVEVVEGTHPYVPMDIFAH